MLIFYFLGLVALLALEAVASVTGIALPFPFVNDPSASSYRFAGSVVGVDSTATTVLLTCTPKGSATCTASTWSGLFGQATAASESAVTISTVVAGTTTTTSRSASTGCVLNLPTRAACSLSRQRTLLFGGGAVAVQNSNNHFVANTITYRNIVVTAGLDKLNGLSLATTTLSSAPTGGSSNTQPRQTVTVTSAPTSSSTSSSSASSSSDNLSTGAKAGIGVGVAVAVVVAAIAAILMIRARRRRREFQRFQSTDNMPPGELEGTAYRNELPVDKDVYRAEMAGTDLKVAELEGDGKLRRSAVELEANDVHRDPKG